MLAWILTPIGITWLTATVVMAIVAFGRRGVAAALIVMAIGAGSFTGVYRMLAIPLPEDIHPPRVSIVYDRNGEEIGPLGQARRIFIDASELPDHVAQAVVVAEDRDFYGHGGISLPSMLRASLANLASGRIVQGGSTITQQYIKNALLQDSTRSVVRKIKESVLAVKLENRYPKAEILDFYLNTIYFGGGSYGIEAASRMYLNKSAAELDLSEAALLAAVIPAPEKMRPDRYPEKARARRDRLLLDMADAGYITPKQARAASRRDVRIPPGRAERARRVQAAFFLEWIRRDLLEAEFGECLYRCGLRIHTTLDLRVQGLAERAVAQALQKGNGPAGSLVSVTPEGQVLAMVGGRPYRSAAAATGFNLATDRPGRQAGSTLKPFALAAAIENDVSHGTILDASSPAVIRRRGCRHEGKPWRVENYGGASYGSMSLAAATASSVNTVYARLVERIGRAPVAKTIERFGLAGGKVEATCALALGAVDVTTLEMAHAYSGLAARGKLSPLTAVAYVEDESGHCIKAYVDLPVSDCDQLDRRTPTRALPRQTVEQVTGVLQGVIGYGTGARIALPFAAAGKTGTSQNNTDAWFSGYTDELAAAVWVGYPAEERGTRTVVPQMRSCDSPRICRPVRGRDVTGGSIPAQIWAAFMKDAVALLRDDGSSPSGGSVPVYDRPGEPATGPKEEVPAPLRSPERQDPSPPPEPPPDDPPLPDVLPTLR